MRSTRLATLTITTAALAGVAFAQFDGPAPVAWRWTQPTSISPSGAPVISGDSVYVAVGSRLFGIDRVSGNQKWKYPNVEAIPGAFRLGVQLVGDTVVGAADNKIIYAVDAKTGQAKWQYTSTIPFQGNPVVAGKILVFALNDNSIMAINGDDGTPAWQNPYKVLAGIEGSISSNGSNVYYMTGNSDLVALSVSNAKQTWAKKFTITSADSTPTIYGDNLYVNTGQYVACLNAASGAFRWQQNVGEQLVYSPAVSPDGALVVTRDGKALLFDGNNGRPKWRNGVDLGSTPSVSPSATGKTFVAPTSNGALNLLSATGTVLWSYLIRPIGGSIIGSTSNASGSTGGAGGGPREIRYYTVPASGPAVLAESTLFVLASDGSLLAFDKSQGVDLTGPSVKMLWPTPGAQVSGRPPLELIFKIDDEATGVDSKTLAISVNNKACEFTFGRDGFALVSSSAVSKLSLQNGRAAIVITVSDWLGNKTSSTFNLLIDNALAPLARPNITGTGGPGAGGDGGRGGGGRGPGGGGGSGGTGGG